MEEKHSAITGVWLILGGIAGLFVVMLMIGAVRKCESGDESMTDRPFTAAELRGMREAKAAREAASPPDARPPDAGPPMKLPSARLYAKAILGKTRENLDLSFGAGADTTDGGRQYTASGVLITVAFAKRKAIWYEADPLGYVDDEVHSDELIAWMAADVDDERFAVDLGGPRPKVWSAKAWARSPGGISEREAIAEEEREAERAARQGAIIETINNGFDEYGVDGLAFEADGDLMIGASGCDHQVLVDLRDALTHEKGQNPKRAFAKMRCPGDHGAWLDLR